MLWNMVYCRIRPAIPCRPGDESYFNANPMAPFEILLRKSPQNIRKKLNYCLTPLPQLLKLRV
jgi:hypothetical protein